MTHGLKEEKGLQHTLDDHNNLSCLPVSVILVVDSKGRYWDGLGWNEQGKEFFSVAAAIRSLHEEGEDDGTVQIVEADQ